LDLPAQNPSNMKITLDKAREFLIILQEMKNRGQNGCQIFSGQNLKEKNSKRSGPRPSLIRSFRILCFSLGLTLFWPVVLPTNLWAFSISETKTFAEKPYAFKLEVQVYGKGSSKKGGFRMSSLKVKIKNEKASSGVLKVHAIRAYLEPKVYRDLETLGYSISPGQWVTKFYRLRKEKQPLLGEEGHIEIAFENFTIRFNPRERKFHGPLK